MSKKIKVNFTMPAETKEFLDEINNATIPHKPNSRSEIIEKILNFDDESAQIFFEIFKYKNQKRITKQQYLELSNGGIIFSQNLMKDIISNLNIQNLATEETAEETAEERFAFLEKIILTLNKDIQSLKNEFECEMKSKKEIVNDQELLDAIAEIVIKKLKDK